MSWRTKTSQAAYISVSATAERGTTEETTALRLPILPALYAWRRRATGCRQPDCALPAYNTERRRTLVYAQRACLILFFTLTISSRSTLAAEPELKLDHDKRIVDVV